LHQLVLIFSPQHSSMNPLTYMRILYVDVSMRGLCLYQLVTYSYSVNWDLITINTDRSLNDLYNY